MQRIFLTRVGAVKTVQQPLLLKLCHSSVTSSIANSFHARAQCQAYSSEDNRKFDKQKDDSSRKSSEDSQKQPQLTFMQQVDDFFAKLERLTLRTLYLIFIKLFVSIIRWNRRARRALWNSLFDRPGPTLLKLGSYWLACALVFSYLAKKQEEDEAKATKAELATNALDQMQTEFESTDQDSLKKNDRPQ